MTFTFVDHVTVIEIGEQSANSRMQMADDSLVKYSADNHVKINVSKTKEMLINFPKGPTFSTTRTCCFS
jgi:hypothetical protein